MAFFTKDLRIILTLILAFQAATSDRAFASIEGVLNTALGEISSRHIDCHISMMAIVQTNQSYLPQDMRCSTTTETPDGLITENTILTDHGIEYDCSAATPGADCARAVQLSAPNSTSARRQYHVPGYYILERELPTKLPTKEAEATDNIGLTPLGILLTTKRILVDNAYYAFGNGFELYGHIVRKPVKIWKRYSASLFTLAAATNAAGVRHQKNPIKHLWIHILGSTKLVLLMGWDLYEIIKHGIHFLNYDHSREFSERETAVQLSSASYELYEEGEDFIDAVKALPSVSWDSIQDLALYTLIVYNGYEAATGMPEETSLLSYFYQLAHNGLLYITGVPSGKFRNLNQALLPPQGVSSHPPIKGPELTVPLKNGYALPAH